MPIVFVQHNGRKGDSFEPNSETWKIHPAIAPIEGDVIVQKHTPDSFHETTLKSELDSLGVENLVVAGIQTEYCVDTTCRRFFSFGYDVSLVSDAHSTWDSTITADQIITHHNYVLGDWFSTLVEAKKVIFSQS